MAEDQLREQLARAVADLGADAPAIELERPRNPEHGDLATNLALTLARPLGQAPWAIAERLLDRLDLDAAGVESAEVAGPGFINFRLKHGVVQDLLSTVLDADTGYGRVQAERRRRIQVEFVSANPTGPLHVAHGRGAALGDVIASLLEWTGHDVQREFYVNDAGVQVDRLAASLRARWLRRAGRDVPFPEEGYRGDYVVDLAAEVEDELDAEALDRLRSGDEAAQLEVLRDWAVDRLRREQDEDLRAFGVTFDAYYTESRLYGEGRIEETLAELREGGLLYESEGATWIRTSRYGDDKDRVLVKSDGTYTYFLPDLAYHREKARRGYDHVIDVWGADHHGYVPRMKAGLEALGLEDFLDVEIVQMVRILRGGQEVKLSKRAGEFVTLRELAAETGRDVARYFFLMRRSDAQMVFDLDLALDHSEKNPVFKIQYAHARMCSIMGKATGRGTGALDEAAVDEAVAGADLSLLTHPLEQDLIKQLALLPETVARAAEARAPHAACEYLEATAGMVNSWYHAGNPNRNPELAVLTQDQPLRRARLALTRAIRIVLRNGLTLLGIDAPERMERGEDME